MRPTLPMAGLTCGHCSRYRPAFDHVVAPWYFGFPIDTLVSRFKHHSQWPLGRLMACLLGQALSHRFAEGLAKPDQLLPVPWLLVDCADEGSTRLPCWHGGYPRK